MEHKHIFYKHYCNVIQSDIIILQIRFQPTFYINETNLLNYISRILHQHKCIEALGISDLQGQHYYEPHHSHVKYHLQISLNLDPKIMFTYYRVNQSDHYHHHLQLGY